VAYTYYDGTQTYGGIQGDLMFAQIEDAAGNVLDTKYYRYSGPGSPNLVGFSYSHAIKYVFYAQSYARLIAALGTNVSSLGDYQVGPYADYHFAYDAFGRVIFEDVPVGSGIGSYWFGYINSNNATDFNSWKVQTSELLPDGNTNTVFSNGYGEVMLKDFQNVATGQHWYTYTRYDAQGRVLWMSDPAAVTGYSTSYADLINYNGTTSPYLSSTQGKVSRLNYYTSTTANETTAGGVAGYLQNSQIQFTQSGAPILQNTMRSIPWPTPPSTGTPTARVPRPRVLATAGFQEPSRHNRRR
jgi:hypothetical protein